MPQEILGIHHVTSIAGDPQQNIDFYTRVLGLRLIKVTVNFDMPETYHLYYGDEIGTPGTILTVFAWPGIRAGRPGKGQIGVSSFSIPEGALGYWMDRFRRHEVPVEGPAERFDEQVITFSDPDGLQYELVADAGGPLSTPWEHGTVPTEQAIRGFRGITLLDDGYEQTAVLLTDVLGGRFVGESGNRARIELGVDESHASIDVLSVPNAPWALEGTGTVHHVAYRIQDDEQQQEWREGLVERGYNVTPVRDRQYFHSIYFRTPGGVLFEIATDQPGFLIDEPRERLGSELKLPPWLEPARARIERALPPLQATSGDRTK